VASASSIFEKLAQLRSHVQLNIDEPKATVQ
jgi:hypothetical protein